MTSKAVRSYVESLKSPITGYDSEDEGTGPSKAKFLRDGKAILRDLAKALGLQEGSYEVRHNAGGPAVSGEAILHGDWIYVQLGQSCHDMGFMWRTCNGRKDYSGNANQWAKWEELLDLPMLAGKMLASKPVEVPSCPACGHSTPICVCERVD